MTMQASTAFSLEFFPPRDDAAKQRLVAGAQQMLVIDPVYCSVTFGAGGSTRDGTFDTVRVLRELGRDAAPHLSCIGSSRDELKSLLQLYRQEGVRRIVALRGDPPAGASEYVPHPGGYAQAEDLVRGLKRIGDFEISVGAYPETHPAALSADADLDFLKRKIDAGATRAITQYFFESETFLRFIDRCHAKGINVPIVPGILPVSNFQQVVKFSAMCGASVPAWMGQLFEGLEDDAETRRMVAAVVAAEQVRLLQANGVDEFHFYTLNRPDLTYAIAHILGARPR